jgi:hypothetical protein
MSRIFDALQTAESERSGQKLSDVPAAAHELLQAAEKEQLGPAESLLGSFCRECRSSMPADSLFCPKCDSFQGAASAGDWDEDGKSGVKP